MGPRRKAAPTPEDSALTLAFALWGLMVVEGYCWAWRGHQLGLTAPPSLRPTNLGRIEAGRTLDGDLVGLPFPLPPPPHPKDSRGVKGSLGRV